ncbi:hypothetical protein HMPREF1640_09590 [Prevotella sp. S7-1-8]|nr:hypothetical protein HMPREF1640_09590 [Prevotella sp. S7-1-8]
MVDQFAPCSTLQMKMIGHRALVFISVVESIEELKTTAVQLHEHFLFLPPAHIPSKSYTLIPLLPLPYAHKETKGFPKHKGIPAYNNLSSKRSDKSHVQKPLPFVLM